MSPGGLDDFRDDLAVYLGLQNHSTEVKFRNLRLGPPVR